MTACRGQIWRGGVRKANQPWQGAGKRAAGSAPRVGALESLISWGATLKTTLAHTSPRGDTGGRKPCKS